MAERIDRPGRGEAGLPVPREAEAVGKGGDGAGGWRRKLKAAGRAFKTELHVYRLVLRDKRTPRLSKFMLGLAVAYALLPFDLIPDFLPLVGHLDDVIIVPTLVLWALRGIPEEVVVECRRKARERNEPP